MGPRRVYRSVLLPFALLGYFLVKFQIIFFASVLHAASFTTEIIWLRARF